MPSDLKIGFYDDPKVFSGIELSEYRYLEERVLKSKMSVLILLLLNNHFIVKETPVSRRQKNVFLSPNGNKSWFSTN